MPYADLQSLVNDMASFYDDTDAANLTIPNTRIARYVHYVQLAAWRIWNHRPWDFKMAYYTPITFSNRQAQMPANFANVGTSGKLIDSQGNAWQEIAFQDMVRLISFAGGSDKLARVFAVGKLSAQAGIGTPGDGGISSGEERGLIIPNKSSTETFTVYYETSPPKINVAGLAVALPFPETFHELLLAGAVAELQQAKSDPREDWKNDYVAKLAKITEIHFPLASRQLQMPMTVGRGMW